MISRGAAASSGAAAVAVLAGAPLRRRGVGVLPLARDRGDGVEHLGGHVAGERVDGARQVWERRRRGKKIQSKKKERRKKMGLKREKELTCDVDVSGGGVQGRRRPGSTAVAGSDAFQRWEKVFY